MSRPGFLLAGTGSGCGKTTVTLGILAALARRGLAVQPFKCGPDFIDPSLHRAITGRISRNLDARMCGDHYVQELFDLHAPENGISAVEGVMGLFDGGRGSGAHLAKLLDLPVILIIDIRSAAESVAAVAHGFATLDPQLRVAGLICNRAGSKRHCALVREAVEQHCRIPLLGCLPRREEVRIPSRHLGLHMGDELQMDSQALAEWIEAHLDLDALLVKARQRTKCSCSAGDMLSSLQGHTERFPGMTGLDKLSTKYVRIGVARDQAFCFYYPENLELLAAAGAELVFFSPLSDRQLPLDLDGLYLGGGYPELHGAQLQANSAMREQIRDFSLRGHPVYGECGGFMYLSQAIVDQDGGEFAMCGVFPLISRMGKGLRRLGYRRITLQRGCFFGSKGETLNGHEFHYSRMCFGDRIPNSLSSVSCPQNTIYLLDDGRAEGHLLRATLGSYVHLHWGQTPEAAACFVAACRQQREHSHD